MNSHTRYSHSVNEKGQVVRKKLVSVIQRKAKWLFNGKQFGQEKPKGIEHEEDLIKSHWSSFRVVSEEVVGSVG